MTILETFWVECIFHVRKQGILRQKIEHNFEELQSLQWQELVCYEWSNHNKSLDAEISSADSKEFLSKSRRAASHIDCNISTLTYNNMTLVMQYFT